MYLNVTLAVTLSNITVVCLKCQWFQRIGFATVVNNQTQSTASLLINKNLFQCISINQSTVLGYQIYIVYGDL